MVVARIRSPCCALCEQALKHQLQKIYDCKQGGDAQEWGSYFLPVPKTAWVLE